MRSSSSVVGQVSDVREVVFEAMAPTVLLWWGMSNATALLTRSFTADQEDHYGSFRCGLNCMRMQLVVCARAALAVHLARCGHMTPCFATLHGVHSLTTVDSFSAPASHPHVPRTRADWQRLCSQSRCSACRVQGQGLTEGAGLGSSMPSAPLHARLRLWAIAPCRSTTAVQPRCWS